MYVIILDYFKRKIIKTVFEYMKPPTRCVNNSPVCREHISPPLNSIWASVLKLFFFPFSVNMVDAICVKSFKWQGLWSTTADDIYKQKMKKTKYIPPSL